MSFILGFILGGLIGMFLMALIKVGDINERNDISKR